jgi:hypothetical protein
VIHFDENYVISIHFLLFLIGKVFHMDTIRDQEENKDDLSAPPSDEEVDLPPLSDEGFSIYFFPVFCVVCYFFIFYVF